MKKFYLVASFILIFNHISKGQDKFKHVFDSLKSVVEKSKVDSIKYKALSTIAEKYWSVNPPEGLPYATQALELAKKMNWKLKICEAYGVLGMNHVILSNNDTAIYFLKKSLKIAEELKDAHKISLASGTLGNVYYFQSNFPQAIEYYLVSLSASEKSKDKIGEAATLSNIGSIYLELNELDKALPYFEKALQLNIETDFKIYKAINLTNIASVYGNKGNDKL